MRLKNFACTVLLGLAAFGWNMETRAAIRLPSVIGDNMVLQRGQPAPIWGWADRGEEIRVTAAGQTVNVKADNEGRWKAVLPKLELGDPLEMTIQGSSGDVIVLKNILVGDVWVASGQSNMGMTVASSNNAKQEIAEANYPKLRWFSVELKKATTPQTNCVGRWVECKPAYAPRFSAAAYFFGRQLHKDLNIPIGMIQTAWGGTAAELWTSRKTLESDPAIKPLAGKGDCSVLYNAMIAPIIPYAIRGAIWYQGESNAGRAYQYRTLFPAMISNWRQDWGQGDFPFGFVQLAPYRYGNNDPANWAELCEAQRMALDRSPNTGMAVTTDIGDVKDIHPKNKQEVGRRLALWALAKVYGRDIVYSGPIYKSMTVEGNKIRLAFEHIGGGLVASDGKPLAEFTIAGEDQKFVPAAAETDGKTVVVHADGIEKPAAVRYAWRDNTQPNLANREGLPASPFRTDSWKGVTEGK